MVGVSCNTAWVGTTLNILQTFAPAAVQILGLVAAFNPGAVPPTVTANVKKWLDDAVAGATTLQDLIKTYATIKANDPAKPGKLKAINDLVATINTDLTEVLSAAHINNVALQGKITNAVGVLLIAIADMTKLVPGAVPPATTPIARQAIQTARHVGSGHAAGRPVTIHSAAELKKAFNAVMLAPTSDPKVDLVSSGLVLK